MGIIVLKKKFRLKTEDIKLVAFKGKKFSSELFDIRVWNSTELKTPVMAVSISTKISKRSTVRNRIKRLFREAFRVLISEGKLKPAKYLVIVRSAQLEEMKSGEIKNLILNTI